MLPTPGFHHLHLNSVDPDAAIDWYCGSFRGTKGEWGGFPALKSPNNVMVLFTKVDRAAADRRRRARSGISAGTSPTCARASPPTGRARRQAAAALHDGRGRLRADQQRHLAEVGGVLGLTRAQIAEARAKGVQPPGGGGFAYMAGPDNALVE